DGNGRFCIRSVRFGRAEAGLIGSFSGRRLRLHQRRRALDRRVSFERRKKIRPWNREGKQSFGRRHRTEQNSSSAIERLPRGAQQTIKSGLEQLFETTAAALQTGQRHIERESKRAARRKRVSRREPLNGLIRSMAHKREVADGDHKRGDLTIRDVGVPVY